MLWIGSTEWVEDNAAMLGNRAVAYLNVDVAVCGAGFEAAATPQLDSLIRQLASKVEDPDSPNNSLLDSWTAASHVKKGLPVEQDYCSYSNADGYQMGKILPHHLQIYPLKIERYRILSKGYPTYHSVFDNFNWMAKFGDPGFHRHVAIARLWGLLALRLADEPLLSFNYSGYAAELQAYSVDVKATLDGISNRLSNNTAVPSVAPLLAAVVKFAEAAKAVERELNDRLMLTERAFIDTDGLAGRPWYKHLVYAPAKDDDYGSTAFPGIKDAIIAAGLGSDVNISIKATVTIHHSQTSGIQHEIWRAARVIDQATKTLRGDLV